MKKVSQYLCGAALAAPLAINPALAANPVITATSLSGSSLTITGSNFGAKSTAAPLFVMPELSGHVGDSATDLGYLQVDWLGAPEVIDTDGINGYSLSMSTAGAGDDGTTTGFFPHIHNELPSGVRTLYRSAWFKIIKTSGTTENRDYQLKSLRAGMFSGANPELYHGDPRFGGSIWLEEGTRDWIGIYSFWGSTAVHEYFYPNEGNWDAETPTWNTDDWNLVEVEFIMNDVGFANGISRKYINGELIQEWTDAEPRLLAGEQFEWAELLPGIDFPKDIVLDIRIANDYLDSTLARVFFGNASTLANVTGKYLVPPTAWSSSGDSITVTAENIPTDYDWVYVTNAAGETNTTGYDPGC